MAIAGRILRLAFDPWVGVRIDEGHPGDVDLGGVNAVLLLDIPGLMERGNWTVGAWIDEGTGDAAFERLVDIFRGKVRGTTGLLSLLVGRFLGAKRAHVTFETDGRRRRLVVPKKIVGEVEPIEGAAPGEPVMVSNTGYWMGPDIVIAQATQSRVRAFGRVWNFVGRSAEICAIDCAGP